MKTSFSSKPKIKVKNKVDNLSRGWPESSFFNSYYTKLQGIALLLFQDCFTLPLFHTWVLSKAASSTIFESLVWLDLGLNHGLPDHWQTLYSFGQITGDTRILLFLMNHYAMKTDIVRFYILPKTPEFTLYTKNEKHEYITVKKYVLLLYISMQFSF